MEDLVGKELYAFECKTVVKCIQFPANGGTVPSNEEHQKSIMGLIVTNYILNKILFKDGF